MSAAPAPNPERRFVDQFARNVNRTAAQQPIKICYHVFSGANAAVYRENLRHVDASSDGYDYRAANAKAHRNLSIDPRKYKTVLLLQGVASPALFWDNAFCEALASHPSGPYDVVRFDYRDSGLSTFVNDNYKPSEAGAGDDYEGEPMVYTKSFFMRYAYAAMRPGERIIKESYTLGDMADDVRGLLKHLYAPFAGQPLRQPAGAVHLVGMCLGAAIGQHLCIHHPGLVASLTCIGGHTSAPPPLTVWPSLRQALSFSTLAPWKLLSSPQANVSTRRTSYNADTMTAEERRTIEQYADSFAAFVERIAGDTRAVAFDRERCRRQMRKVFERSGGTMKGGPRQFLALLNAPRRDEQLRARVTSVRPAGGGGGSDGQRYIPTLIIQGDNDVLCPAANAKYLHECIRGSTLRVVDGMGHTLPPQMRAEFVNWITENITKADVGQAAAATAVTARGKSAGAASTTKGSGNSSGDRGTSARSIFNSARSMLTSKL